LPVLLEIRAATILMRETHAAVQCQSCQHPKIELLPSPHTSCMYSNQQV